MKLPAIPAVVGLLLLTTACRKSPSGDSAQSRPAPVVAPSLQQNQLAGSPSSFLRIAADSRVNWQPWDPSILDKAEKADRLIFALIGSSRYPGCLETVAAIERDRRLVQRLNREFVPVLVDLDVCREAALIASVISPEAGSDLAFPFLMLLTFEGSPVTWQPFTYTNDEAIRDFFSNSVEVVSRLWDEAPDYILSDSRMKLLMREERVVGADLPEPDSDKRKQAYYHAMRRIGSFYDEDLRTIAGAGGLFPAGLLDCLSQASIDASLPDTLRRELRDCARGYSDAVLRSAMIDPLDGGIYSVRRGGSWELPAFTRDCGTQARICRVLVGAHHTGVVPNALPVALNAIAFAEANFSTPEGLFALTGKSVASPDQEWLWTLDQIEDALTPEEFKVWTIHSGLESLGNLNPSSRYFRLNSLAAAVPPAQISEQTNIETREISQLIESGRKKLLKARQNRHPVPRPDPIPSATASFRMVSAFASLYTATANPMWRDKAIALAKESRTRFCGSRFMSERLGTGDTGMYDARAFTYAIAIQAGLDLGAITLEDSWNLWAHDLADLLGEYFVTESGRMSEVRQASQVIDFDHEDRVMLFDDSTVGLMRLNLSRLEAIDLKVSPALNSISLGLPPVTESPVIFTDTLRALSHRWSHTLVEVGEDPPPALIDPVTTLPLERYERRRRPEPAGKVRLTEPSGATILVGSAAELLKQLSRES